MKHRWYLREEFSQVCMHVCASICLSVCMYVLQSSMCTIASPLYACMHVCLSIPYLFSILEYMNFIEYNRIYPIDGEGDGALR